MDSNILVDDLYFKGERLIKSLDEDGIQIPIALVGNLEDEGGWSIILGADNIRSEGLRPLYLTIQKSIKNHNLDVSLNDIKLIDTRSTLALALKGMVETGPGISRIILSGKYYHGIKLPDAIIYRVNNSVSPAA